MEDRVLREQVREFSLARNLQSFDALTCLPKLFLDRFKSSSKNFVESLAFHLSVKGFFFFFFFG